MTNIEASRYHSVLFAHTAHGPSLCTIFNTEYSPRVRVEGEQIVDVAAGSQGLVARAAPGVWTVSVRRMNTQGSDGVGLGATLNPARRR